MTHTTFSPIEAFRPNGGIDGFRSTCETCGMVLANTFRSNVEFDQRDHAAYFAAKAARSYLSPRGNNPLPRSLQGDK